MVKTEGESKEKKKLKSAAMLSPKMPASIVTASFSPTPPTPALFYLRVLIAFPSVSVFTLPCEDVTSLLFTAGNPFTQTFSRYSHLFGSSALHLLAPADCLLKL